MKNVEDSPLAVFKSERLSVFIIGLSLIAFLLIVISLGTSWSFLIYIALLVILAVLTNMCKKYILFSDRVIISYFGLKTFFILTIGRRIPLIKRLSIIIPVTLIPGTLYFKDIKDVQVIRTGLIGTVGKGSFIFITTKRDKNFGLPFTSQKDADACKRLIDRKRKQLIN